LEEKLMSQSLHNGLVQGFLTWGAEINFRGCWGRSHMWR